MPRIAGHPFTRVRNLDVDGVGTFPGLIALARGSVDPSLGANDGDFLYNLNGNLTYEAAGVTTTLGAVGGVGTTWESLYSNDNAWALTGAFTITQSTANTITINKTEAGAGAVLTITNSGTGNDVTATNWAITQAGALTCVSIADSAAGATLQVDGNGAGGVNIGSTSTGGITLGRATTISAGGGLTVTDTGITITAGGLTVTAGGITVSDEFVDIIDNSNTVAGLRLTNNTITTWGVGGASTGAVLFRSTSLTTGSLLSLQLAEGALVGGFYLRCFDTTGGADVFTVGEDGAVVIAGVGGSNVLTLTLGDVLLSDGSITITDADNANTLAVTNNTATTASVIEIAGSGVFTGTTTSSFMEVSASGLTTGTLLRLVAAAATTSVGVVDIATTALTTGSSLRITEATATFTTGARAIEVNLVAATAGNGLTIDTTGAYTGTGLITCTAGAMTTGVLVSLTSTTGLTSGSLLRMTTSTAGAVATNGICSIRATGAYTSTSNAGLLDVEATATTAGTVCRLAASAAAQTTSSILQVIASGYTTGYTGVVAEITGVGTTGAGTVFRVASAQTTAGQGVLVDCNGITTGGIGVSISHTTSVIGAGSSMLRVTSTGIDTGTTTGTLLDLAATAATSATLVLLTSATLNSGIGVSLVLNGLTTGEGMFLSHTTSVIADGGSLLRLSSTSIDTGGATNGTVLDIIGSGQLAGVAVLGTFAALTTGTAVRVVANALTSGILLDLETSDAGMAGSYIRCFDGAAVDFSVGEDGRVVLAGAAGITAIAITAGDVTTADGAFAAAIESITLGVAAATFAADSNYVRLTGDAGGNSVTTITGGLSGQILVIEFRDALVTIVNDNTDAANTIDLVGANTTFAADATLTLGFNGTSWKEITRSVNA